MLELLEKKKQRENERELDEQIKMLSMMLGTKGKINFSEEDEEKEELRIRAQRKRDNIRDDILCDHQEKTDERRTCEIKSGEY